MRLRAVAAVGLECTLGHRTVLMRDSLPYGQVLSIADSVQIRQSLPSPGGLTPLERSALPFSLGSFNTHHSVSSSNAPVFGRRESSSSLAPLLRLHRISVVNSPQNLSVFEVTSHVFTNSGATYFFADNGVHSMLPSVLVSAPFTTEFSGVTPQPWIEQASANRFPVARRDSGRGAKEADQAGPAPAPAASPVEEAPLLLLFLYSQSNRAPCVS
jgi:hypothetical protein